MDLTVVAIPFYFGSMAVEHAVQKRRAAAGRDVGAGAYTRADTLASMAMGVGSLAGPLVRTTVMRRLVPGRTRAGTAVALGAVAAAAATTLADHHLRRRGDRTVVDLTADDPAATVLPETAADRVARAVQRAGGVAAVAGGIVVAAAGSQHLGAPARQWRRRSRRDLGNGAGAWALAMVGVDLIFYLNHRLQHEVRMLWAIHVVHHSSEHYNLSTAVRQPVTDALGVFVPYGLLARLGVRPSIIEHARALDLLYQYWIHTEAIRTMGAAEAVLNSPSHHRVHHGSNRRYLDRNHAGILIVWDRLLGTFAREDPTEPPVYGLTRNVGSFHPLRIATHEWRDIAADVAASTTWRDRLGFVLRGPGWAYRRRAERTPVPAAVPGPVAA